MSSLLDFLPTDSSSYSAPNALAGILFVTSILDGPEALLKQCGGAICLSISPLPARLDRPRPDSDTRTEADTQMQNSEHIRRTSPVDSLCFSEESYRQMVEQAEDIIFQTDVNGKIIFL